MKFLQYRQDIILSLNLSILTRNAGRTGGDSGKLFVAEKKPIAKQITEYPYEDYPQKMLVKHCYTNDAANEFMSSRIAERLGVPMPKVCFISCPAWKTKGFETGYICGIEYIEGLRNLTREEIHSKNGGEFTAAVYSLSILLEQSDGTALAISDADGSFYTYDCAATFVLENFLTDVLFGKIPQGMGELCRDSVRKFMEHIICGFKERDSLKDSLKFQWKSLLDVTGNDYEKEKWEAFIGPVRKFPELITDEWLDPIVDALFKYYAGYLPGEKQAERVTLHTIKSAEVLKWYYEAYIATYREMIAELLNDENALEDIRNVKAGK